MRKFLLGILLLVCIPFSLSANSANGTVYLSASGNDSYNGTSWSQAVKTIGRALALAKPAKKDIWIAGGTYAAVNLTNNFEDYNAIVFYGGFKGNDVSETVATRQKPAGAKAWEFTNPTIWQSDGTNPLFNMSAAATAMAMDGIIFQNGGKGTDWKGGVAKLQPGIIFRNCIIRNNHMDTVGSSGSSLGSAFYYEPVSAGVCIFKDCYFYNNTANSLATSSSSYVPGFGAIYASLSDNTRITIDGCTFEANTASRAGGAFYSANKSGTTGSVSITNSQFIKNNSYNGGVIYTGTNVTIDKCIFAGNEAARGGALYLDAQGDKTVSNSIFYNNSATFQYSVYCSSAGGKLINILAFNNKSASGTLLLTGGGELINSTIVNNSDEAQLILAAAKLHNNIIWGNKKADGTPTTGYYSITDAQNNASSVEVTATNTANNIVISDNTNNVFGFKKPTTFTGLADTQAKLNEAAAADWSLIPGSQVINKGNNSLFPSAVAQTDLSGEARIQLSTIDMGAYESATAQTIIYVSTTGNDGNDGSSWALAKKTPLAALDYAKTNNLKLIYMAAGSYPVSNITQNLENYEGISIYGGFKGSSISETPAARPKPTGAKAWEFTNTTIWQGDGANPFFSMAADNLAAQIVFDGITFSNGCSTATGSMLLKGRVLLRNSVFRDNKASGATDAYYRVITYYPTLTSNTGLEFRVEGCYFLNNSSGALSIRSLGSGVASYVNNCLFEGNSGGHGAALIYDKCSASSLNTLSNTSFIGNTTNGNAMGIVNIASGGYAKITGCNFSGNKAYAGAGVASTIGAGFADISGCIFKNNTANSGAAIYSYYGKISVANSLIFNNTSTNATGSAADIEDGTLINTTVVNNIGGVRAVKRGGTANGTTYNSIIWGNHVPDSTSVSFSTDITANNSAFDVDISQASKDKGSADNIFIPDNTGNIFGFKNPTSFYGAADTPEKLAGLDAADWTVRSNSVIINKGKNDWFANAATSVDLAGNNRVFAGVIDQGAYESAYTPEPIPDNKDLSGLDQSSVVELDKGTGEYTCAGDNEFKGLTFKGSPESESNELKLETGSSLTITEDLSLEYDFNGYTDKWIFLSVPFDMDVTDGVHMVDGTAERIGKGEVDFGLRVYDSENRSTGNMTNANWWNINHSGNPKKGAHTTFPDGTTILKAGQGFIFYLPSSAVTERKVRFYANGQTTLKCTVDLSVNYYSKTDKPDHAGWQLIGLPLTSRNTNMSAQTEDNGVPSFVYAHNGFTYVTNPTDEYQMRPFVGYFMQVSDTTKDWRFASNATKVRSLRSVQSKSTETVRKATLSMVQAGKEIDRTTVVFDNNASKNYVYNEDALKLFYSSSENRIYTVSGGREFSYNLLPGEGDATQTVQMKSIINSGSGYRIAQISNTQGFSSVMIQNAKGGEAKDLMKEEFALQSGMQTYTLTFVNTPTGVDTPQMEGVYAFFKDGKLYVTGISGHSRLYNCSGSMIWEGLIEEQPELSLPKGIYILETERGNMKISK